MGLFNFIFRRKPEYTTAVNKAEKALRPQVNKLLSLNQQSNISIGKLSSEGLLCLLHGFVSFYAHKYHLNRPEHKIAVTFRVFIKLFGDKAAERMIQSLQAAMKNKNNMLYITEGNNAAKYYEIDGLQLVEAFLDGINI